MSKPKTPTAALAPAPAAEPLAEVQGEITGDGTGEALPPIDDAELATELQPAGPDETVEVRALMDDVTHGLAAGQLAVVLAASVGALKAAGAIDDHPDAVAYAKAQA